MNGKIELKWWMLVAAVLVAVGLGAFLTYMAMPDEAAVSRAYQTAFYVTSGGDKAVVASGGELEVQSGGTLDIQSGATTDFSGGIDLDGALLDLDADGDTSIQADTDDQIDFELGAADVFVMKDWTATALTNTTEYLLEIADSTGIGQSGTNAQAALNIDMGIGNSTAGTNNVYGMLVDGITGDAQSTEYAISIGDGWAVDLAGTSDFVMAVDEAAIATWKDWTATALTNTTEYILEIADTTGIGQSGTNAQAALNIDMGIGNSTAGTNNLYGILIDGITGDAQSTEYAMSVGDGWAVDLNGTTDFVIGVDGNTFLTLADPPAAGASGDLIDLTDEFGIMDGSDTVIGIDVNLTGANHTGASNNLYGIDLDLTTADADASEVAIELTDTDWDTGIKGVQDLEHLVFPTVASEVITYNSSGTLWTCGATEVWFIHSLYCNITTNFDSGGSNDNSVHIGDSNDEDGFIDLADAELQTSDTEGTGAPAGWQGFMSTDTRGAYFANGLGFVYTNDTIDIVTAGTGADAGEGTCYLVYTRIQ